MAIDGNQGWSCIISLVFHFLFCVCLTRNLFFQIQSRLSPFANTRGRKQRKDNGDILDIKSNEFSPSESENARRWFPFIDAATLAKKKELLPVKKLRNSLILNNKLHRTLYGFIVFEVAWNDVRGINYFNELQV